MTAADDQATFAATLVDEWVRAGVTDAVVAPGSRSTPMVQALAGDGRLRVQVVLDERSAGFRALGLGLASGRPAVVVTTSGTAAVELHPAVVEAHQAGVALVVLTADRPPELHGVGAPQTVDQVGLFGPAVRWSASPGVAERAAAPTWRSLAARAVAESVAGPAGPGPVHLNLAFREPLLGAVVDPPPARAGGAPWHTPWPGTGQAPRDVVAGSGSRGLIVAGAGAGDPASVGAMAAALGWPVLADPRSGCRVPGPLTVAAADGLLRVPALGGWRPDVVVRLGQPWASRVVATWLAGLGPGVPQVLVDPYGRWSDPERAAGDVVRGDPGALCRAVAAAALGASRPAGPDEWVEGWTGGGPAVRGGWAEGWAVAEAAAQAALDAVLAGRRDLTEPGVARALGDHLPDGAILLASSSMPVRDVEWYLRPRPGLRVLANRGANGIDGVISTGLGVASANAGPTVALLGDLAFLYDAGALVDLDGRALDLTLVVVDNDGGGIFSFLPQSAAMPAEHFERFWGTPHRADLAAIAAGYGVPVTPVGTAADLGPAVGAALDAGGPRVVLVKSSRRANVAVHEELNAAVAVAVTAAVAS